MISLLNLSLILASLTIAETFIIYSAQCRARCQATYKEYPQNLSQCLIPCLEKDHSKLNSCYRYCNTPQGHGAPCHFSCKFIKGLHYKDFLPGTCSLKKQFDGKYCGGNRDCGELTKCCYGTCEEISLPREGITITVNNVSSSSLMAQWQETNIADAVYIVQARELLSPSIYYSSEDWDVWHHLRTLFDVTRIKLVDIHPGTKLQIRLAVVNSSGLQSIGPATDMVRTLFNATYPSGPEITWVEIETYEQDEVKISLSWLPPEILDIPVHRYRLYWKEIPQITTDQVVNTKKQTRVEGSRLNYTITGLKRDKNYLVEIQAICMWKKKRLKSPKVAVNVSTTAIKGSQQEKIEYNISNMSKFKRKHSNSSIFHDINLKGIKVIIEEQKEPNEAPSEVVTPKGSGRGLRSDRWTTMLLSVISMVYLFVWRR